MVKNTLMMRLRRLTLPLDLSVCYTSEYFKTSTNKLSFYFFIFFKTNHKICTYLVSKRFVDLITQNTSLITYSDHENNSVKL